MASDERKQYRLKLSYDGTDFYGWQKQPNQSPTIQQTLEDILSRIYNEKIQVVGSGRTDRGVHALAQWAHTHLPGEVDIPHLQYKLQRMTPSSISIKKLEEAPEDFHAQISAISKCYKYRMFPRKSPNPLIYRYSWHYRHKLDMDYLQRAAEVFLGEHDFASFQSKGTQVSTTVRKIFISRWVQKDSGFVDFQIQGSGFLKQMVRNIVGTMLWHHEKKTDIQVFRDILEARDRTLAAPPAPAQGLFLTSVQYPQ
ncbi:MAG: tRNA pseudouridine(38-40) synthase TruA [Bdellovibrionales bacterium]|nr:tRNA pseudouridine(38-40) synthase TruA [Bdellovibrionales bacterium]NQZ19882.1 tRNA pseudouridine(38-40) synthase TruA [Bdellovibrionales bacterium]